MNCPRPDCGQWNHVENDACVFCDTKLEWAQGQRGPVEATDAKVDDASAVVAEQQLAEQPSVPCPNPDCKQLNAKENVTCAFCDEPLQMLEPVASTVAEAGGATALGSPTAKRGMEEVVSCPACTFLNPSTALICAMCNEPVPSAMGGEQKRSRVSGGDDADLELLGPPTDPGGSTPEQLKATQQPEVRDATVGIVENLMDIRTKAAKATSHYYLCSPLTHYCQRQTDILGHWSCGYRNLQMLSSSLIQRAEFKRVMYGGAGFVPEVRFLQRWIEAAWHAGFDVDGCAQLGGSLAGKSTWIGPSEVVALLRSFGVKAVLISVRGYSAPGVPQELAEKEVSTAIVEFVRRYLSVPWHSLTRAVLHRMITDVQSKVLQLRARAQAGLPPPAPTAVRPQSFFEPRPPSGGAAPSSGGGGSSSSSKATPTSSSSASSTSHADEEPSGFRPPLYLQHAGHSRTIIGLEEKYENRGNRAYNLLIFDPAMNGQKLFETTRSNYGWQRSIKRGEHTLVRQDAYQLCVVLPGLMEGDELEAAKFMDDIDLRPSPTS